MSGYEVEWMDGSITGVSFNGVALCDIKEVTVRSAYSALTEITLRVIAAPPGSLVRKLRSEEEAMAMALLADAL